MRRPVGAVMGASMMMCLTVPFSTSAAQPGISTNAAPVEVRDYLSAARALSEYELASSRLALARSRTRASQTFARMMVGHHTRAVAEHARLLDILSPSDSGSALIGPLSEMLNSLENTPPAGFDAAYRRGQIAAHEEALKVHSAYAAQGSDPAMRARAGKLAPTIRKHLDAARTLPGA